ncbi:MAG: glycoside hydrolase family 36 protein [Dehalococcoidia bacterium]
MTELPWGLEFAAEADAGLEVRHAFDALTARLAVSVTNTTGAEAAPRRIRLTGKLDLPAAGGHAWVQGRYMQTDAFVHAFGEPVPEGYTGDGVRTADGTRRYISREMVALSLPVRATPAFVAGSLRGDRFFLDIDVELDEEETSLRTLSLVFDVTGVRIAPGETLELQPVLLSEGRGVQALAEMYADEVATEMGARVPDHVPTAWCSWYQFYDRVTEEDVLRNLDAMRASGHPAEFVQIDDGYQPATGDWLRPNAKFPSPLGDLAERIREAGYRPGIWLAPLVLNERSEVLASHPEIALRGADGEILFVDTWLGRCAVVDCTHPQGEAFLRGVVGTMAKGFRFEYLKLDALAYAAQPADRVRYHQPGTTAAGNLRRGLEIMRDAAGEKVFLLGCTCHFLPAVGLVDGMRVGPDVKALWNDGTNPSVRHAMRMTLARHWMHGRWWANDPDCLIVRTDDTALSDAETRFLATGIALSGGMVVATDDLPALPAERRAMALTLFPPTGVAAHPYDTGEGPISSTWRANLGEGRSLVGVLNWGETSRWVVTQELLAPGEVAFDVWNARLVGMGDLLVRPHEGLLLQITATGQAPRVVGDSGSLTGKDLFVRQVSGRVQVRNDADRPRVIAIEARGQRFEVDLAPGEMRWYD